MGALMIVTHGDSWPRLALVEGGFDAFLAVGGGSAIDTAKAANLYSTWPADFFDYVNAPIGRGLPVPGPLKPLIAIPTTAGTGSETTGVAIFDLQRMHAKTGIASRRLKPTLGYLDPENTRTLPPEVAASTGLDILSHAVESFTAAPYTSRPHQGRPALRPAYQGANPVSDIWALEAMRTLRIAGFSVTTPHKQDVAGAVDELDPAARALRSVNTVVNRGGGHLVGYSTDGDGFVAALGAEGVDVAGMTVLVLGAGGLTGCVKPLASSFAPGSNPRTIFRQLPGSPRAPRDSRRSLARASQPRV